MEGQRDRVPAVATMDECPVCYESMVPPAGAEARAAFATWSADEAEVQAQGAHTRMQIECRSATPHFVCRTCFHTLREANNTCPICRGPLIRPAAEILRAAADGRHPTITPNMVLQLLSYMQHIDPRVPRSAATLADMLEQRLDLEQQPALNPLDTPE